ncbi:MAG: YceI family protein [Candidatus Thermochlorobacter sp.]
MLSEQSFALTHTINSKRCACRLCAVQGESILKYQLWHPLHATTGSTQAFLCEIELSEDTQAIQAVRFVANVTSFDSGNSDRDARALELIEAQRYPEVSFQSSSVAAFGEELHVSGELCFHGITKNISFYAKKTVMGSKLIVAGTTDVSLTEFKVERPSLLMIRVNDALKISFTMTFALP